MIVEVFVEVSENLEAKLKKCVRNGPNELAMWIITVQKLVIFLEVTQLQFTKFGKYLVMFLQFGKQIMNLPQGENYNENFLQCETNDLKYSTKLEVKQFILRQLKKNANTMWKAEC